MEKLPFSSIDDVFEKINANLRKQGNFHVGKCHGKTVSTAPASSARRRGGRYLSRKQRAAQDSNVKTTLFPSQLAVKTPLHESNTFPTWGESNSPAGNPAVSINGTARGIESETDSKPNAYVPLCTKSEAGFLSSPTPHHPNSCVSEMSFRPLSWEAPSLVGPSASSFAGFFSPRGECMRKRCRDEDDAQRGDDFSNTATAKIAAAASSETCMELFPYTFGLRYTSEEADDLVSFADRLIPTNGKRAKKSS
mmetsp:Transcript_8477/g.17743  ORF Transcript_8477/g.17743 Transcript_8477/m.17743 type:complete len:251 (-) Transcript_8477:134-886(-)